MTLLATPARAGALRSACSLLVLLAAGSALAEPDTFGLGTGRSGALVIDTSDTVVNRYTRLTANAAAGMKELTISEGSGFSAGELVLLHQSTGLMPGLVSGDQNPVNLHSGTAGRFEYARVEQVLPNMLQLTAPLLYSYTADATQVVSVPEYTDLQLNAGGSIRAEPWDGSMGGIVAVLVSGALTNDGLITVKGAGFRGGTFFDHPDIRDCTGFDVPESAGGTYKGEGLVAGRYGAASGRGNLANGGGGGNCHNSGGGGGGHAGAGGLGGFSFTGDGSRDVGGLGGAPVVYLPYEHLLFGGGGGSGEGDDDLGTGGAAGGGLILIRARQVLGTGSFSAAGASADGTRPAGDDGAGGGGAGGAISVRAQKELMCGSAVAYGGAGGDSTHTTIVMGPGGGGAGGVVFLQGESITCPASVLAGAAGLSVAQGDSHGAGPAKIDSGPSYGSAQPVPEAFRSPNTPVLTQPADGATGVPRRPSMEGTAEPGVLVQLYLDGIPYAQVLSSSTDGAFVYTPTADLALGAHELSASAQSLGVRSAVSEPTRFDVVTQPTEGDVRPILVVPGEGERVDPTPVFAGTSPSGVSVSLEVDGTELALVPLDGTGRFRYALTAEQALAPGAHKAVVHVRDEAGRAGTSSQLTSFEVLPSSRLDVGCGCGSTPGAGLGAVALLLGAWAARRRRES
ncbi:adventurous gliding motility protein AgmC [Hyalangium sp.]|uniref:adventurous gliding motility protein AgmC n=1 Tax=Hyalangium sp. TaxID=2028555 RepID=UPI0039C86C51